MDRWAKQIVSFSVTCRSNFHRYKIKYKVVILIMVELDNMKQELLAYKSPLAEVRDSL